VNGGKKRTSVEVEQNRYSTNDHTGRGTGKEALKISNCNFNYGEFASIKMNNNNQEGVLNYVESITD
jgi:hypothetical protein